MEVRSVYHRKPDRIRAHVFAQVLSLLLSGIMEERTGKTIDSIRKDPNYLGVVRVSAEKRDLYISSESMEVSDVLKSFRLPYPESVNVYIHNF